MASHLSNRRQQGSKARNLREANKQKQEGGEFIKIYIKKDVQASIREGWKGPREAGKERGGA